MNVFRVAVVIGVLGGTVGAAASGAVAAVPQSGTFKAAKVQRGYDLRFDVRKGKVVNLVTHVLETCGGSSTSSTTTVGPGLAWTIKGGQVRGRLKESSDGVTLYTTLEGRFTGPSTLKGTIRQESIVAGARCDTLKLQFTARR